MRTPRPHFQSLPERLQRVALSYAKAMPLLTSTFRNNQAGTDHRHKTTRQARYRGTMIFSSLLLASSEAKGSKSSGVSGSPGPYCAFTNIGASSVMCGIQT